MAAADGKTAVLHAASPPPAPRHALGATNAGASPADQDEDSDEDDEEDYVDDMTFTAKFANKGNRGKRGIVFGESATQVARRQATRSATDSL